MDLTNLEELRLQVGRLIEYELLDSAESVLQLALSKLRPDPNSKEIQALCYQLIGDICHKRSEFKRALSYYNQALQQLKFTKRSSSQSSLSSSAIIKSQEEADLKHKCCKCNMMLLDYSAAIKDLEIIPACFRTVAINITLCKLYKKVNLKNPEVNIIKAILKEFPIALELIGDLINLDEPVEKVKEILGSGAGSWLDDLTGVFGLRKKCEYVKAQQLSKKLIGDFPQCPYTSSIAGNIALESGDYKTAKTHFLNIKRFDPLITFDMDKLGYALFNLGEAAELNKLANDTLLSCESRPEGWLVGGLSCHKQCNFSPEDTTMADNAISFYDKGIQLDPNRSFSYFLKGRFMLENDQGKMASVLFFQANVIEKSVHTYQGLINSALMMNRLKESVDTAKEAMIAYPNNAIILTLFSNVLAKHPNKEAECIQVLKKALTIDPVNIDAICLLSEKLVSAKKKEEAAQLLQSSLARINNYRLHNQYASIMISEARYTEAMEHLHISLGQQPTDNEVAMRDIDNLDAILKGKSGKTADSFGSSIDEDDNDMTEASDSEKHMLRLSGDEGLEEESSSDDAMHFSNPQHRTIARHYGQARLSSEFTGSSEEGGGASRLRSHFMPESEDQDHGDDEYMRAIQHRHDFEEFSGDEDVIAVDRALFRD